MTLDKVGKGLCCLHQPGGRRRRGKVIIIISISIIIHLMNTVIMSLMVSNVSVIIRELLFQSLSDQLLAAYSDSTPFPFGSVI